MQKLGEDGTFEEIDEDEEGTLEIELNEKDNDDSFCSSV